MASVTYLMINNHDYSAITSGFKINNNFTHNVQQNAVGDMVVDVINEKKEFEITIIPLNSTQMQSLLTDIGNFNIKLRYLSPYNNSLTLDIDCIVPQASIEYYTIRQGNTSFKAFTFKAIEL